MFGYACNETPELMPLPISLAHRLSLALPKRHNGTLGYLLPGKTQVSVVYENDKPVSIDTILISTQHTADVDGISDEQGIRERITKDLWGYVVEPATADLALKPSREAKYLVNPTGKFVVGGPQGDAGLTGHRRHLWRLRPPRRWCCSAKDPQGARPCRPLRGQVPWPQDLLNVPKCS